VTPFLCRFHGKAGNAPDFGDAIVFQIPGPFCPIVDFRLTFITEINTADEFPDDEDIRTGHNIRFERRILCKNVGHRDRPQVGIQPQSLAQSQECPFRPQGRFNLIPFVPADSTEQNSIGMAGGINGLLWKRRTRMIVGRPAGFLFFIGHADVELFIYFLEYPYGSSCNFFADSVSGNDYYVF